jgi:hypothetical protein
MTRKDTPALGWRPIPAPPIGPEDPTRPSEVEVRLAALLDPVQTHPETER